MTLDELRNLNVNDPSSWPLPVKIAGVLAICALILGGGYHFVIADEILEHERAQLKEVQLRDTYLNKKLQAINLPAYKAQLEEIERTFGSLLRQLPNTTEVPDLLVDITQAGLGRGLEFVLFRPEAEQKRDFYAELPISLQVTGSYHEFASFVSDVAALPRIVTFGDVTVSGAKDGKSAILNVVATARTYRYLDPGEGAAPPTPKAKSKKNSKAKR
ncbi:pilus assembly protein PilO [Sulfurifustis variabilis]|uniref:Pilus assembly protein PilO n=1 Tax=Sulfurifustis variabilis TaxID=1675686 RepID=A0A1B4V055_9GAMM|nr:type 4a pilus biogenesis protein PilO [Sulfurifustis variabilis]BAU46633.1 pilus assembly protein PilO [Sulfurifustis variabilis]